MNHIKKAIMIAAAGLLIPALSISAQPGGGDGPGVRGDGPRKHHRKHRRKHMRKLMKKLDLSWSQRRQARSIRKECRAQSRPEREKLRAKRREIRKLVREDNADASKVRSMLSEIKPDMVKMGVLRLECRNKFHAILNDDQKKRFAEFRSEHRARKAARKEKWKEKRKQRKERMRKYLGLSDDQVARINALKEKNAPARREHRTKMRGLRDQAFGVITAASFDAGKARGVVEQIIELRTEKHLKRLERRREMRKILTPEQRAKMRELWKKRHDKRKGRRGKRDS